MNCRSLPFSTPKPKRTPSWRKLLALWAAVLLLGNAASAQYCNSAFTNVTYEFLTNVTYAGINNSSGANTGGPVNYTSQVATVVQGASYSLSVTMDPDANDYIYAWIDWNHNNILNDAGEQYILVSNSSLAGPHVLNISTPPSALTGNTRMRVMVDWNNSTPNPCRSATYGEAEDYTVNVQAPTCNLVTGLGASGVTSSAATISWTCTGCSGNYIVEYGAAGFTPGLNGSAGVGGTIWTGAPVASSPVTITGLGSLTNYSVYVRQNCGGTYSPNVGTTFLTLCSGTTCNYSMVLTDNYGDGWNGGAFEVRQNGVSIGTYGTANLSTGCGPVTIPLNVCHGATLSFVWTADDPYSEPGLRIYDPFGVELYSFRGSSTYPDNCPGVNFSSPNTLVLNNSFSGYQPVPIGSTFFSTVTNCTPPACSQPTSVSTANVTGTTADVSWVCAGCPGPYIVEYGLSGFTPGIDGSAGVGGTIWTGGPVAGTSVTLTGLSSTSNYKVYVRQVCGGGGYSGNTAATFATGIDCASLPVLTCGTSESFILAAGNGSWNMGNSFCSPPGNGTGPYCTYGREKVWQFNAPNAGTYTLNTITTNSQWIDFFFKPAGSCDATGWTYIDDILSPQTFDFTITTPGTYYLLADAEGNTAAASQTFSILCPLPCATPNTIGASNITSTSASINWTCTSCTGNNFIVEYGLSGFALGTGLQVTSGTSPVTISGLANTTTYQAYVRQDCNNVGDGLSNWRGPVTFTTLAPPPANDDCSGAIAITCGATLSGNTANATPDAYPSQVSGGCSSIANGVWYVYTASASGEQVTVSTCDGQFHDSRIHVFRGTCGSLIGQGGNDDAGASCSSNGTSSTYTFNALPNFTYYIVVESYTFDCTFPTSFSFQLSLNCGPLCNPVVANDECVDAQAIAMTANCTPQGGNLSCATATAGNNPSCIGGFNSYPDAYYTFQATAPNAFVTLTGGSDLWFQIYNGSSCTITSTNHIACVGPVSSGAPNLVTGLVTGNTYTLRVMQLASSAGVFSICVQKLDVTDDPCAAIPLVCGDLRFGRTTGYLNNIPSGACPFNGAASTSGVNYFSYTAPADADVTFSTCGQTAFNTRISVFEGACTSLACNVMNDDAPGCPGNSSEVTVRAFSGQTYTIMVTGAGATDGNYQLSVFCQPWCSVTDANDRCANSINVPTYITGTGTPSTENQACSYADAPPSCSGASMVQGVWYDFTTGPNTIYDVYIGVNALDPNYTAPTMSYALYGGACSGVGAAAEVDCQLNASGTYPLPALTPFSSYKLLVYNTGGTNEGTFGLMVTHPAYNDGSIASVVAPDGLICDQKLFPQVWLKNYGEAAITSAQIISRINGSIVQTYNWSGPAIQRGDSSLISLPVISSPLGQNDFSSEVGLVNGTTDELSSNNSASSTYDASGQTVKVVLRTDANANQTSWVIYDAFFFPIGQSADYTGQNGQTIATTICLPTVFGNCYYFFVFDQAGDGMSTGSWLLTDVLDRPVLQDNGAFGGQSPPLSPATSGYFAHEFCLPLGPSTIQSGECNVFNNLLNNKVFTSTVPGVTSYQFEFSDPNAGFRRRIAVPRNWVKFSEMQTSPLAFGTTYFCRVRVDQGSSGFSDDFFGAGCEMALNPVQPICTELISTPGPTLSCGVTKMFGGSDKVYAQPVTGATQYRFNFTNTGLGYTRNILRPTYVCLLSWVTQPLVSGNTYDVKVEALVSGVWSGYCGATCQVTIFNPAFNGGGGRALQVDEQQLSGEMQLWPNPVVNNQLNVRIDGLSNEDQQVSIDLYDIFGKRVMAENMDNSGAVFARTLQLPQGIARGVYTMNITINGTSFTKRVTVQ